MPKRNFDSDNTVGVGGCIMDKTYGIVQKGVIDVEEADENELESYILLPFEGYGDIVEIDLIRDKKNWQQVSGPMCFKFSLYEKCGKFQATDRFKNRLLRVKVKLHPNCDVEPLDDHYMG